jgi:dTDP-4-dehydrorhamnose 3,5-epimerase
MKAKKTDFSNAIIIAPEVIGDKRGYFYEAFNYRKLNQHIGHFDIHQINQSKSSYGVLRGLHFQRPPYTQAKIVQVLKGTVLDVIVDIQTDSPTFGQHQSFLLDERDHELLYIPRGFAHGFVVLSRNAKFQYAVDNYYSAEHDDGIFYADNFLDINWEIANPKLSIKDRNWLEFDEMKFHLTSDYQKNP